MLFTYLNPLFNENNHGCRYLVIGQSVSTSAGQMRLVEVKPLMFSIVFCSCLFSFVSHSAAE